MKISFIYLLLVIGIYSNAIAQGGPKWSENGNTASATSFLGTTTNFPLLFKVNNIAYLNITPGGQYQFHGLNGSGNGLIFAKSDGVFSRIEFTGNPNDYLRGDGTFGAIAASTLWTSSGGGYLYL